MKRVLLTLLTLVMLQMACVSSSLGVATPTAKPSPTKALGVTKTPTVTPNARITTITRPLVNVRKSPNGLVVDTLRTGTEVEIVECSGNWCQIVDPPGYVYRGCLSDNPAKLGCSAK